MVKVIDTADNVTDKLDDLKAAGVESIIRYDDRWPSGNWKQVHLAEVKAIAQAGLRLGIVYEHGAQPSGENNGYLDAMYSRKMAKGRGQPDGSAIYFAVDYDPSPAEIRNNIIPYFRGIYKAFTSDEELPRLRVGAYCSGMCADSLRREHPDILIWITCSLGFAGSREAVANGKYDLWQGYNGQHGCDKTLAGVDCDFNTARNPNWGDFVPWAVVVSNPPPLVPSPPPQITHDAKWLQGVLQTHGYYHGEVDGIIGPLSIAAVIAFVEHYNG